MVKGIDSSVVNSLLHILGKGNGKSHAKKKQNAFVPDAGMGWDDGIKLEMDVMLDRIKAADHVRKCKVHQVIRKLQNNELITSESVREAAERLIDKEL